MTATALISVDAERCQHCWRCARTCPVHAVRVTAEGAAEVIGEKCVACGLCVLECPHSAIMVRDDGRGVDALLADERPVVALLAAEYSAALHPRTSEQVEATLERVGFHAVESTLLGEEAVALAYEQRHAAGSGTPVIRSTCPVVVDFVRKYHPGLSSALAPVEPPYVAQAKLIKQAYPDDVAVVYVSPCYARKDEALLPELAANVDAAIDFQELIRALDVLDTGALDGDAREAGSRRPEPLKEVSLTDGFPRSTLTSRDMTAGDVKVVRGIRELDELLTAIEAGEAAPLIVDALNCEGCLDGPAVNPHLSLFAKRDIEAAERRSRTRSNVSSREILRHLPALDLRRAFLPEPVRLPEPTADELGAALRAGGFDESSLLDCGACGRAGCRDFAMAVFRGEADWRACPPSQEQKLARDVEAAEESATVDALTGLANRRVFSQRLGEEFARQARYGGQASLLMLDVDTFKGINDRYGHLSGDKVLTMVADTIRATLRSTDVPVRYGGDEFAIILPQTGKTEAFAVAEKVRLAVAHKRVGVSQGDSDPEVGVHVSVGVASSGPRVTTPLDLIEAADKALYQAKEHGRNQVRLAPG